jgi:hypothetical protein
MLKPLLLRAFIFVAVIANLRAADRLLPLGSTWKFWDQGAEPGSAAGVSWHQPGYSDSNWSQGPGELGYGDGDETTLVSFGPNGSAKYITTYFRKTVTLPDLSALSAVQLRVTRDDGAVVYLNGAEVGRFNMPSTAPAYSTYAIAAIEETTDSITLSPALFNAGENLLAVEIHQANATSSDLTFDLELLGTGLVTRGPYLQLGTSTNIVVRWRTAYATNSVIHFGTSQDPATWTEVASANATTEHEVNLTSLQPGTAYYYSVNNPAPVVDANYSHIFYTAPTPGSASPVRIWALGDSGTADANAAAVRNAYYNFAPTDYTDLLLMLGDNAYENGLDAEYQTAVFDMYPDILRQTVLWPTIGNHDTANSTVHNPNYPYFSMFTLPTNAEAGGLPSGVENYYSFDYANVHFVCLDSMTSSRQPGSAMLSWLEQDLAANSLPWVIAFWHHPPYSKGSHDSDNNAEVQMIEMRSNVLPILDSYNVDLVLAGHSHSYERSLLLSGHYGKSTTLAPEMILDDGSGRTNDSGAYNKSTGLQTAREGAVYIVAGSSGKKSGGTLNHPAMFLSLNELGSLVLDIAGNQLDVKFLRENGQVDDYFTIVKGNQAPLVSIDSPANNSEFSDRSVLITATASDPDGQVVEVSFFADGTLIGTDSTEPYSFQWTGDSYGAHTLIAEARDNHGVAKLSAPVSITFLAPPPSAPANLVATAISGTQVQLTWTDTSSNETGFTVERSGSSGEFTSIATVNANATTYTDNTALPSTQYFYRLVAFNSGGASAPSETASVTTPQAVPIAPGNLVARGVSTSRIDLTWDDRSTNEDKFVVQRKSGKNWLTLAELPGSVGTGQRSYSDVNLSANTTYTYRVRAENSAGSAPSNDAVGKTLRK